MKRRFAQVLVVDDDAIIAFDLRRLLLDLGAETAVASFGEKALELVRERRFDLIILSIHLPGISGLEVCRRLKLDPKLEVIPVIFLSGEASPSYKADAFRLGAADYLTKPYDPKHFKARVLVRLPRLSSGDEPAGRRAPAQPT